MYDAAIEKKVTESSKPGLDTPGVTFPKTLPGQC